MINDCKLPCEFSYSRVPFPFVFIVKKFFLYPKTSTAKVYICDPRLRFFSYRRTKVEADLSRGFGATARGESAILCDSQMRGTKGTPGYIIYIYFRSKIFARAARLNDAKIHFSRKAGQASRTFSNERKN